jgi:hypothetical protein
MSLQAWLIENGNRMSPRHRGSADESGRFVFDSVRDAMQKHSDMRVVYVLAQSLVIAVQDPAVGHDVLVSLMSALLIAGTEAMHNKKAEDIDACLGIYNVLVLVVLVLDRHYKMLHVTKFMIYFATQFAVDVLVDVEKHHGTLDTVRDLSTDEIVAGNHIVDVAVGEIKSEVEHPHDMVEADYVQLTEQSIRENPPMAELLGEYAEKYLNIRIGNDKTELLLCMSSVFLRGVMFRIEERFQTYEGPDGRPFEDLLRWRASQRGWVK